MIVKKNRLLMSETDVYKIINGGTSKKIDLSWLDKSHFVPLDDLKADFELMKTRNLPAVRLIVDAVYNGSIIISSSKTNTSSVTYVFGSKEGSTKIDKVFVNVARFSKMSTKINYSGDITPVVEIIGGYEVLYTILLSAYMGLNSDKVFLNATTTSKIREIYTDLFAQIISRNFLNPVDGVKFRFMVNHFFFNGQATGAEVAQLTKFPLDQAATLSSKYPEWFARRDELSLIDFINLLAEEFPSLGRRGLTPESFVIGCVTALGDNAVYMIDNYAYLVAVITAKARKSKVFAGYMLKTIESDAGSLLSALYQSVI